MTLKRNCHNSVQCSKLNLFLSPAQAMYNATKSLELSTSQNRLVFMSWMLLFFSKLRKFGHKLSINVKIMNLRFPSLSKEVALPFSPTTSHQLSANCPLQQQLGSGFYNTVKWVGIKCLIAQQMFLISLTFPE